MNEQTTKLIEQLAQKLGTTADYLWAVLTKQAPVDAAANLLYLFLSIIIGIALYRLHRYLGKERGEDKRSIYWEEEGLAKVPMGIAAAIWAVMFLACFFTLDNIINGFFNPEYWALKEVLKAIK